MVNLSRWRYDGVMMWGMCQGHEKLADGTYIHTSPVTKIELCDEGLNVYTYSGTHYRCKTEDIMLDALENIKECLENEKVDTSFLNGAVKLVEEAEKVKIAEVEKLLEENDLYIDIVNIGLHFFLKNVRPYAAFCCEA